MYRSRRRRRGMPINAEINITNLVDVAFVLLIIFIITAPILQGGIEVDLPEASATPVPSADPVLISIAADNSIFLGNQQMGSLAELEALLGATLAADPTRPVALKGDQTAQYGRIMAIMDVLGRLDKQEITFITNPPERGG